MGTGTGPADAGAGPVGPGVGSVGPRVGPVGPEAGPVGPGAGPVGPGAGSRDSGAGTLTRFALRGGMFGRLKFFVWSRAPSLKMSKQRQDSVKHHPTPIPDPLFTILLSSCRI